MKSSTSVKTSANKNCGCKTNKENIEIITKDKYINKTIECSCTPDECDCTIERNEKDYH